MGENNKTRAWRLYEKGRDYNTRLVPSQYQLVETNTEFFNGNQWLNLPDTPAMRELPKPTFNILKRIASLFVASLTSSGVTVHFEPLAYYGMPQNSQDAIGGGAQLETEPVWQGNFPRRGPPTPPEDGTARYGAYHTPPEAALYKIFPDPFPRTEAVRQTARRAGRTCRKWQTRRS
ncbi:MAG: hypothetical protein IJT94_09060 [Oscillibacter sp.]|nr:hypothetical protein [Oscillibacter sp.]